MIAGYPMSAQIESRNYERNIAEIEKIVWRRVAMNFEMHAA